MVCFMPQSNSRQKPPVVSWLHRFRSWFIGLLLLSGLTVAIIHFGEIEQFAQLVRQAAPEWLIVGLVLQVATYFSTAAVWYQALQYAGVKYSMLSLVPLGVAKLFSDQAFPSAGMSGTAFFVTVLNRRGISTELCMATLLVSLVTHYIAYLLATIISVVLLGFYHAIYKWIIIVVVLFSIVAVVVPVGALWLQRWSKRSLPPVFMRIPGLANLLNVLGSAPDYLLHNSALLAKTILFQEAVFLLDSATLWVMLRAMGQDVSFLVAFPSFVVASIVATLGPIPLGLGTFEATCVAILKTLGIPFEVALTATLLLRGFTLWLPMLPGLWLVRRELP